MPARVTRAVAASSAGSTPAIRRRDIDQRCAATTSIASRSAHGPATSAAAATNRSCPLPPAASDGAAAPRTVYQPSAGSTGRKRRTPSTKSCVKRHLPRFTSGIVAVQRGRPSTSSTVQPPIRRPPLNTGRAPGAARTMVGDFSVPESSRPTTSVSASS